MTTHQKKWSKSHSAAPGKYLVVKLRRRQNRKHAATQNTHTDSADKEEKRATATCFDLAQRFHQTVMDKDGNKQESWDRRKRPI